MVEEVILPQEKQQILDEINGWLNTVYPYKNHLHIFAILLSSPNLIFVSWLKERNMTYTYDSEKHGFPMT